MKIIYIDPLKLTHPTIKEMFKRDCISVFNGIREFLEEFDERTVTERRVIIADIPLEWGANIESVKKLIFFRALSKGSLKIVLFSDYTKIRYGFNRILLSPDVTIDKRTNLEIFYTKIKNIFKNNAQQSDIDAVDFLSHPRLTYSEYFYVVDLFRGKSIHEISKTSKKSIKVIYTHRKNICAKYNFKNVTELHSALVYE